MSTHFRILCEFLRRALYPTFLQFAPVLFLSTGTMQWGSPEHGTRQEAVYWGSVRLPDRQVPTVSYPEARGRYWGRCLGIVLILFLSWYLTDYALTNRVEGHKLINLQEDGPFWMGVTVVSFLIALVVYLVSPASWLTASLVFLGLDSCFLLFLIVVGDAFTTFCSGVLEAERQETERKKQATIQAAEAETLHREKTALQQVKDSRTAARSEVEKFHAEHFDLLKDVCPAVLLKARINTVITEDCPPEKAWAAAADLMAQLQQLIVQEREKRKAEEDERRSRGERARHIQNEIDELTARKVKVQNSPLDDPEVTRDEVAAIELKVKQLQEQKDLLATLNP